MRVLHLTLSAARGGRRDAILTLIDHLRPLGVECGLVALRNPSSEIADVADRADYTRGMEIAARPTREELEKVRQICIHRGVNLVHAHDHGSQYVASRLRLVSPSLRAVMTFHRTLGIETEGPRNRVRNAISLPWISRVLTASDERRNYFLHNTLYPSGRVRVIPLGVDFRTFHPDPAAGLDVRRELGLDSQKAIALAIGHFGPEKGIDQALEAAIVAAAQLGDRPWHLVVLGSGDPQRAAALAATAEAQLPGRVTFVGFRADVARWLQAADLLIHAPRQEAFGLVVLQAMACGLPVLGFGVGGVPELVETGKTGTLFDAGNVAELGGEIARMLRDDRERRRLGERALGRAMQFYDARESARQHMSLYREVLPGDALASSAA